MNLTDNPALPLRKLTGKAGRLPGCPVRDKVRAAHLVSDVGLADQAVGRVRHARELIRRRELSARVPLTHARRRGDGLRVQARAAAHDV